MVFKIELFISGDNFWPKSIMNKIWGNFIVKSFYCPNDKKFKNADEVYGYGGMSFWHPKKFTLENNISVYEQMFVVFIENNYQLFVENGVEDFCLYIEVYYDGGQCNFEIFDRNFLQRLAKFKVSMPVSVYALNKKKYREWVNEIQLEWEIL